MVNMYIPNYLATVISVGHNLVLSLAVDSTTTKTFFFISLNKCHNNII